MTEEFVLLTLQMVQGIIFVIGVVGIKVAVAKSLGIADDVSEKITPSLKVTRKK